ncbi:hypothetical protein R1flu_012202 [Riccia fluitans]|uniref:Uncharacterized protein n=1 Tax=Riccia fluitans TaxID=41844 RepID=A0ABD1ZAW4_9MARC
MKVSLKRTMSKKGVFVANVNWIANDEFILSQPAATQNGLLYSKPRAAPEAGSQLTDNPLFQGINADESMQRYAPPRLSLEESRCKSVARRSSLSLSAKDYEGIWRAVQEDVSKSTNDSKSPLEDFNEFRQKLALLKQDMAAPTAAAGRPGVNSTGSARSVSISPSRPTSPLKRLSVITSRRIASSSGLKPQLGPRQRVPPSVQKIAVTVRAESLFKLPNPASISPAPPHSDHTHHINPPLRGSARHNRRRLNLKSSQVDSPSGAEVLRPDLMSISTEIPKGRELTEGSEVKDASDDNSRRVLEDLEAGDKPNESEKSGEAQVQAQAGVESRGQHSRRWGSLSSTSSEREDTSHSTASTRRLPVPCGGPRQSKTSTQQEQAKKGNASSAKDRKVRCISIPRPVCYSANNLE